MRSTKLEKRDQSSTSRASSKRERFSARLTGVQKELFQRAADLTGRSLTDFVLSAAQDAAEETIRNQQILELTARETAAFLAALDNPPRLNLRLEADLRDRDEPVKTVW
jgi:uncharacterized protein (DUF1778 family)